MEKHVTVVGAIKIGMSILYILIAILTFSLLVGIGFASGDEEALPILVTVGSAIFVFFILISIPGLIGGIFLLKRRPWARILVIILAVIDLFNVPLGTAFGIYAIWVLIQEDTIKLFAKQPEE